MLLARGAFPAGQPPSEGLAFQPGLLDSVAVLVTSDDLPGEITRLLKAHHAGDRGAFDRLVPLVYDRWRALARIQLARERPGQMLSATGLVEARLGLGLCRAAQGRVDEARGLLQPALERLRGKPEVEPRLIADSEAALGRTAPSGTTAARDGARQP